MEQTSQGTKFYIQSATLPASTALTAATKAAPTVLTVAAGTPFAVGEIAMPKGTGWRSLDNRPFQVSASAAASVTLAGSDTVAEVPALVAGTLQEIDLAEICMATLTFTSPAGTIIDVTTLCDVARETVSGLPGIPTWQATGFWDGADPMQDRLRALYRSGEKVVFACIFPDGSGFLFVANVNSFDVRAGVDQAVAITVGGTMSGPITDIEAGTPVIALASDTPVAPAGGPMASRPTSPPASPPPPPPAPAQQPAGAAD